MAALELKFLGQLEVVRAGERIALPPSKKTRALLAYLALNPRTFRREHLCELLWEIPDDPRGSLRWSLSKLRQLVDDEARCRLVADPVGVRLDTADIETDIASLSSLTDEPLGRGPHTPREAAATRHGGVPLAGLDLPNFHDYSTWLTGERELATRAQLRLLRALLRRLDDDPERALPHAFACVRIEPYDEAARATLIALLVALGRHDQAAQQYQLGLRLLAEAGVQSTGALARAMRAVPARARPANRTGTTEPAPAAPAGDTASPVSASPASARAEMAQDRRHAAAGVAPEPSPDRPLFGRQTELKRIATALERALAA